MPYVVTKIKNGYKVCRMDKPSVCLSKKPLTKKMALKQEIAVRLSELRKAGRIAKRK
jgi:hypothetical protein